MANEDALRIVSADRFVDFIIIGFSNGKAGRYSAALLYDVFPRSEELFEPEPFDDFDDQTTSVSQLTNEDARKGTT